MKYEVFANTWIQLKQVRKTITLITLLFLTCPAYSQDKSETTNKFDDYPAGEIYVGFFNPIKLNFLDGLDDVQLDLGYKFHKKKRMYIGHQLVLRKEGSSAFDFDKVDLI